jgi:hypothetical protein
VLLVVDHTTLEVTATALNHLGEAGLHVLQFVRDEADCGIDRVSGTWASGGRIVGIRGSGMAGVVVGVRLHRSKRMIPDIRIREGRSK